MTRPDFYSCRRENNNVHLFLWHLWDIMKFRFIQLKKIVYNDKKMICRISTLYATDLTLNCRTLRIFIRKLQNPPRIELLAFYHKNNLIFEPRRHVDPIRQNDRPLGGHDWNISVESNLSHLPDPTRILLVPWHHILDRGCPKSVRGLFVLKPFFGLWGLVEERLGPKGKFVAPAANIARQGRWEGRFTVERYCYTVTGVRWYFTAMQGI